MSQKSCFRIGCQNEPTEAAKYPQPNYETKTIHFCQQRYRILENDRIIKNGKVEK